MIRWSRFPGGALTSALLMLAVSAPVSGASKVDVPATRTYRDVSLPVEQRVADLLSRMTIGEKLDQMRSGYGRGGWAKEGDTVVLPEKFKRWLDQNPVGEMGATFRVDAWTRITLAGSLRIDQAAATSNRIQKYAIEHSRLGIPLLFSEDMAHGLMLPGCTVFPTGIGMASTWNTELARRVYRTLATEGRALGVSLAYSPIVDVVRDPRWGRVEECYGEDPYLCAQMGVANVTGFMGDGLASDRSMGAMLKHFVHAVPEGGHNAAYAGIGPRELREVFLPPFRQAVAAGACAVMAAYTDIDGVPCNMNRDLLTGILRDEWHFQGIVVPDAGSIDQLHNRYHIFDNFLDAQVAAVRAGIDMEGGPDYREHIMEALRRGLLSPADIDRSAGRVLRIKFLLGLFERPYVDPELVRGRVATAENRAVAREAVREAIVLLKNSPALLPLRDDVKSIAVIGPNADNVPNQLGDYTAPQHPQDVVTVLEGLRHRLPQVQIRYARGCAVRDPSRAGFAAAVAVAQSSDVAIVVVGGSSDRPYRASAIDQKTGAALVERGSFDDMDTGEGFDRMDLGLSGVQADLVAAIKATGKPLIVVLVNGRPLSIPAVVEQSDALLEAWYGGSEGGAAIAEVLCGDYNPSGRLPISVARNAGQLPVFYAHRIEHRKPYVEMDAEPLFPFGFGLSYTTFAYSNLRLSPATIRPADSVRISVDVTNTGKVAGTEVVQLYVHDEMASVTRPFRELKGFRKISLAPGETKTVVLALTPRELAVWGTGGQWRVEPGAFEIMAGSSCVDIREKARLMVIGT